MIARPPLLSLGLDGQFETTDPKFEEKEEDFCRCDQFELDLHGFSSCGGGAGRPRPLTTGRGASDVIG